MSESEVRDVRPPRRPVRLRPVARQRRPGPWWERLQLQWQRRLDRWYSHSLDYRKRQLRKLFTVVAASAAFFAGLVAVLLQPPTAQAAIASGDGLTIYGSTETGKTTTPQFRNYIEVNDAFDSEQNTATNGTAQSFAMQTSPIKTEAIAAYEISTGTMQVMCYDGNTWSNEWTATVTNNSNTRMYDIAYSQKTGNVMVLYGTGNSSSNELAYRTKSASTGCGSANWSSATNVTPSRTTGAVEWVDMAADPNSNNIAAIWADSNDALSARIWNGTTWQNEPSAALDTDIAFIGVGASSDTETFGLTYETVSSNLMIVWGTGGRSATGGLDYERCTGGTSTCTWQTVTAIPTITHAGSQVDVAANPKNNTIIFGANSRSSDELTSGYWNGSSWSSMENSLDGTTEAPTAGRKLVTANWMINGSTTAGIIMYSHSNSQGVDYFTVNGSGTWNTTRQSFNSGSTPAETPVPSTTLRYMKSKKDPYHLNRDTVEFEDSNNDLFAKSVSMSSSGVFTWSNSDNNSSGTFTGSLNRNISSSTAGPFAFSYWNFVPTPGPTNLNQDGYIFENDDGTTADSDTVQAAGNTAITGVRIGERLTIRFQMRNTGVDALSGSLGLFYDRNDGYFVKANDHSPPNTAAGNCTDTNYNCGVVDNTAGTDTGTYASMAFDNAGQPWVSYYDATGHDLVVAKYVSTGGSGCGTSGSSAWQCTIVYKDATNQDGQYTSIGFDGSGVPWVSFYDATNTNLMVAKLHTDTTTSGSGCGSAGSTKWDCTTVDNTDTSGIGPFDGQYTSIAFDQSGNPGIAYIYKNSGGQGVKYAHYVGSGGTGCATGLTTWNCEYIDSTADTDAYTSIQFDHANHPWVAYADTTTNALNVVNYVGGSNGTGCGGSIVNWTCTQVDANASVGTYPSLMFGPTGVAWVSYYDATNTALKVADYGAGYGSTCNGGVSVWTCGTIDNQGADGQYTSLAQDASGEVVVSYYDATNTAMKVARYVGSSGNCTDTGWNCGDVDNTGTDTGSWTSAATAPDGNLWVAFYDTTNTALRTAQVTRGGEIIPAAGAATSSPGSITESDADITDPTNPSGTGGSTANCLTSGATWNNGVWGSGSEAQSSSVTSTSSILPAGNTTAQCTEVAFTIDTSQATAGQTYRFILASSNADRPDKGIWRGPSGVSNYATLTIQSGSVNTQRFSKDTNPSFATCDGTASFGCEGLDSTNSVGQYNSIAFDPAGTAWVSYYDSTNTAMRVAHYVGSGGTGCANTQWTCIQMENQSGRTTGQYSSIAVGRDGTPWVAYRDSNTSTGGLKVANRVSNSGSCASIGGSTTWNCTLVDEGNTGQYTSIAMSPADTPWVAYYNNGGTTLRVATYVGANGSGCGSQPSSLWSCFTVDSSASANFGQSAYLGFDGNGNAWISYYDATNGQLRVAKYVGSGGSGCASTQWTCTVVDSSANVGSLFTSMSFDSNGLPWISYYDATNTALKVAKYVGSGGNCTSAAWNCTTVDNTGSDGEYSSIAFDANGNPWVSYWDSVNGDLRMAQYVTSGGNCTSTAWNCFAVNTGNTVGQYTSLAFDNSGDPWVAYNDATNGDLDIAKQSMPTAKPSSLEVTTGGPRNARTNDARFHMDNGLAPRNATTNCNANVNYQGYCGTLFTDGLFDSLNANPNEQPFFLFVFRRTDDTLPAFMQWTGDSAVAASSAALKLEVYNVSTGAWETIVTNNTCGASSACRLVGSPSGTLSNYYDSIGGGNYNIYFRVSQAANTTGGIFQTDSLIFAPTTDELLRGGEYFDSTSQLPDRDQPFFWAQ